MNKNNITFEIGDNGCRLYAICNGKKIGNIFFVRVGRDKIMISDAEIDPEYSAKDIELYLVEEITTIAREQHRKIMSICPYISEIFIQHPEFDDVRLLNNGR
ncbi:MAG: N-acetyltransferase [Alphaproteobacteria bacterium]|nr:N-acetyltransferase [Alphaproteobacteria bacterium]